jgi:hypothetical protein
MDASRKPPGRPQMTRLFLVVFAAVAGLAVAVDGFLIEPYRIEVTHSSVQAPLTRPLKIAQLSDLHTSGLGRRERQLLSLLDAENPDIIVITGDTVTLGHHYENIRPVLSHLHARLGVWLVGLDDPSSGTPNLDAAFSTVPQGAYVIVAFTYPRSSIILPATCPSCSPGTRTVGKSVCR